MSKTDENVNSEQKHFLLTTRHSNGNPNEPNYSNTIDNTQQKDTLSSAADKEKWDNGIEFLFSCISLSVGLGNVWRFPFIAFQNGGGAFVVPYLIVLVLIGRPVYYLEILIGQFSSRGCFQAFNFAPILKGVTAGQVYTTMASLTYYASIMALTLRFLIASFSTVLPWSYCRVEWMELNCLENRNHSVISISAEDSTILKRSSAELYFLKEVLKEKDSIHDGLGYPNMDLVGCLAISWLVIFLVLIKGVKSSGKAAYFLGVFPYVVMLILLVRSVSLPGAIDGISYFFTPQWRELLNPQVWYAAITQVFFSLAICFGTLITYASYNNFSRNVYKDIIIITIMDSCSSLIAGCIIFGILGNLALETDTTISSVVKGGAGLAFISYPDAISKFTFLPQVFAVLFFMMLFVLGVGSTIAMSSCIIKVIRDQFNTIKPGVLAIFISIIGFAIGLIYMTPGGQFVLNLIDFYGVSFVALVLAIGELIAVAWIYGVKRFCEDIYFMLGIETGLYWRICWGFVTPGLMIPVLIYTLYDFQLLTYKSIEYPPIAYAIGGIVSAIGLLQLPFWALWSIFKQPQPTVWQKICAACRPAESWGPLNPVTYQKYIIYRADIDERSRTKKTSILRQLFDRIFG